jgi:hypothetical protein
MSQYEAERRAASGDVKVHCYIPNSLAWVIHDLPGSCDRIVREALLEWLDRRGVETGRWR